MYKSVKEYKTLLFYLSSQQFEIFVIFYMYHKGEILHYNRGHN